MRVKKEIFILLNVLLLGMATLFYMSQGEIANYNASVTRIPRKGVWITNVGSHTLFSKKAIQWSIENLSHLGINSTYPVIWNKEDVFFESKVVSREFGSEFLKSPNKIDILTEVTIASRAKGMSTLAWYENGLKFPIRNEDGGIYKLGKILHQKGWLTKNKKGQVAAICEFNVCKGFLNISVPEVRNFVKQFITELVSDYDIEGIMIDDHFSWHPSVGYDSQTIKNYKSYLKKRKIRDQSRHWDKFRQVQITELVAEIRSIVKKHGKKLVIAPGGSPQWSKNTWLQDWQQMVRTNAVDEVIMQSYRYDLATFMKLIENRSIRKLSNKIPFGVAILAGLKGNDSITGKLIYEQTKAAVKLNYEVSYFHLDTLYQPATRLENANQRQQWLERTIKIKHQRD